MEYKLAVKRVTHCAQDQQGWKSQVMLSQMTAGEDLVLIKDSTVHQSKRLYNWDKFLIDTHYDSHL